MKKRTWLITNLNAETTILVIKYLVSIDLHYQCPSTISTSGNWSHVTKHMCVLRGWLSANVKGSIDTDS